MADLEVINLGESHIGSTINISNINKTPNTIKINESSRASTPKSVNFGPGVEMLMNDKKKSGSHTPTSDINMTDLDKLESELNNLSSENIKISRADATSKIFSSTFSTDAASKPSMSNNSNTNGVPISVSFTNDTKPNIATSTSQNGAKNETWDGSSKLSLENDMIPKALNENRKLKGFVCAEKFIDIGIPEDYQAAASFF